MTREKASVIIGNIPIEGDDCYTIAEYQEAKAMAIKALEQIEIWNATTKDRQIIAPKGTFRKIWEDEQQPCEDCFTDDEKRIFLASVAREMRVCEVIDSEKTKVKLVPILERVKDKVLSSSLWKEVEE